MISVRERLERLLDDLLWLSVDEPVDLAPGDRDTIGMLRFTIEAGLEDDES